jgi:hypothetical protein
LLDEIMVDGKEVIVRGQYINLIGAITKKLTPPHQECPVLVLAGSPVRTKLGTEKNESAYDEKTGLPNY